MSMAKTLGEALLIVAIALTVPSVCSAERVRLDFAVNITAQYLDLDNEIEASRLFDYSLYVDTAVRYAITSDTLPRRMETYTEFADPEAPPSSVTAEVLGAAGTVLPNRYGEFFILDGYDERGWHGESNPSTFQSLILSSGANERVDGGNRLTSYLLQIGREQVIGLGNQTTIFTESSVLAYLTSLVGDAGFLFGEAVFVSELEPATNRYSQVGRFGY